MKKIAFHWQVLIGLITGILFGVFLKEYVPYISWMGVLFLRGLRMIIIPLVLTSIISGIANIGNARNFGRLGLKTMFYYTTTSLLAILTGLFLVNQFKPGVNADLGLIKKVDGLDLIQDSFSGTLIKIIPTNIFESFSNGDMLPIIFFALLFGFFITQTSKKSSVFMTDLFNSFFEVMMKITMFVIKFTPIGILGIVSKAISEAPSISEFAGRMGIYMLTVLVGLFIHAMITLPVLVKAFGRVNPFWHLKNMLTPLITAFSTASSSATLPLTMNAVEFKSGVSNKITSFTLPLGATVNMDGTALYECVAALFIAQAYGVELTIAQQAIVVFTALLASIGAAGIPMAGLVMISIILSAVGLPLEGVGLILAVDPLLDMFRTTVNVYSDTCGAVIIAKSEGEILNDKTN